jgi:hypothetical protein
MARELSTQVLVVNRHLQAVHITTARRAFVLMISIAGRRWNRGPATFHSAPAAARFASRG